MRKPERIRKARGKEGNDEKKTFRILAAKERQLGRFLGNLSWI